jgi:uncharacterized protein (TIGR02246 family)
MLTLFFVLPLHLIGGVARSPAHPVGAVRRDLPVSIFLSTEQPASPDSAIRAALQAATDAWNRADLAGHVASYADSATFMTHNGPVPGRDQIAAALGRGFWASGRPRQQLRFEQVVVRPLGTGFALVTGHFVLFGGGEPDKSGWFSLTWARTDEGWRIIHDHSS